MATSDRRPYLTATVLDQALLDQMQDNLDFGLEMVADIESPAGFIRASDRNKYVGSTFYQALTIFPVIKRTVGEWLQPGIEFSTLELSLSNVDGRFNNLLPGGNDYAGWIGKEVSASIGLKEVSGTYTKIFEGQVTDIGGAQRDRTKITVIARDQFDRINRQFPQAVFSATNLPDIDDGLVGAIVPIIYGDWTTALRTVKLDPNEPSSPTATVGIVPSYPVNGKHAGVLAGTTDLQVVISENDNLSFNTGEVYLERGGSFYKIDASDIHSVVNNRQFQITQAANGGVTVIEGPGADYQYGVGDVFWVQVKGKDIGGWQDNIVWQARDILINHGGAQLSDFSDNWETFRDKASPIMDAIANIKSRVWIQEPQGAIEYVLSMFEQVRLEIYPNRDLELEINSLHFSDWTAKWSAEPYNIRNWDVVSESFEPKLDELNAWNRARADFSFNPGVSENAYQTSVFRNSAAVTQSGKEISKKVVFPNLYDQATVEAQLKEMIRLASGYAEFIDVELTARAFLLDIGDFVKINVKIGSSVFEDVPGMIREIGYDPKGPKIILKVWSFQMIPFPGYSPGYSGIVGGSSATITEET